MNGAWKRPFGPLALTTSYTTNVYQGGGGSALIFDLIRHIHIVNKTNAVAKFRLYLSSSGDNSAGKELFYDKPIQAYDVYDYFCMLKMTSSDYLVGGSDTSTALTIYGEGEQYVV